METNNNTIPHIDLTNSFLTGDSFTLGHLKLYLRMKYPSYKSAGVCAGLSSVRVRQIVTGKFLPKTPQIIKRIADGWGINEIILTQLFERCRK